MSDRRPDSVEVVTRRVEVLEALGTTRDKRGLVAMLDQSRSTVDRAIRELDALGFVSREDGYRRTVTGELVLESFREFRADLEDVGAASALLRPLPQDTPMSRAMLRGARVEVASGPSPSSVLEPVFELTARAERARVFSVAMTRPDYADQIREFVTSGELTVECVYSRTIIDYARENREGFDEFVAESPIESYVIDDLPYALKIADLPDGRAVAITVYDDDWTPRGIIVNDSTAACDWAEELFERYRRRADPLSP